MTFIIDASALQTFEECLDSADSRNSPLSPADFCELKRSLNPHLFWDYSDISVGTTFGNPQFPGVQIFAQPTGPYQDEPVVAALPTPPSNDAVTMTRADVEAQPGFAGWNNATEYLIFVGGVLQKRQAATTTFLEPEEDVSDWIHDLGRLGEIAGTFFGDDPAPVYQQSNYQASDPQMQPANGGSSGPGPPVTFANCGPTASPVWKKVCGVYKWVYPKRRRRRQLLTNRDYDDLLKLQTLKVNSNMTAAISKALTR